MSDKLSKSIVSQLNNIFSPTQVLFDDADCWPYGYDNSKQHYPPDAVVLPSTHEQVAACVSLCNQHRIALTTRGRGTGTTGASVPITGGIVLSMERMNNIINLDAGNRSVRVESGLTNLSLQNYLAESQFFWPPDPSSAEFCSIGGNLACNAAGPCAVKYGTTRENTLQLKAVTGKGDTITTGSKTTKGVVGLDLTRLLIGSEGTLAIITEAELKIHPLPPAKHTMRVLFNNHQDACQAIQNISAQLHTPCAIEFMDHHALNLIRQHSEVSLADNANAMLMIELDGDHETLTISDRAIQRVLSDSDNIEINVAKNDAERKHLWQARKALSPILRNLAPNKINEDIVVPVPRLSQLLDQLDKLSQQYQLPIVNFGHAGNGNLHVNIMYDANDNIQNSHAQNCLEQIFTAALDLDGTISGEHGVGLSKRDYVSRELGINELTLMHSIKQQFDPNNILNPNKSLPDL